jgi:hypothetical protein
LPLDLDRHTELTFGLFPNNIKLFVAFRRLRRGQGVGARPRRERGLARGELRMITGIFSYRINTWDVKVYDQSFLGIFPSDRAMAPNGHLYFPGGQFREDFSSLTVPLSERAKFIHECAHLYQHYTLGWNLIVRGPFSRNYDYTLEAGKKYEDYGLEQMGMIAEHFYLLRNGQPLKGDYESYTLADYAPLLPIRDW